MKINLISLGCAKNLVDSETIVGILAKDGHSFTDDTSCADVVILNTCEFIGSARKEAKKYIKKALKYGAHEIKLYRKNNSADMKPLLLKYFNNVNNEYDSNKHHTTKEWDKIKLSIALDVYYENFVHQAFSGVDPWLVFFRRTVMHNIGL